jgi:L-fuconolactonase
MQLIDSHVHFWRIGHNGQVWPGPDMPDIHRDFLEGDLAAESADLPVAGVVAVQSQPDDADTDWLLSLADASALIAGVVGWVDLAASGAVRRLQTLAENPKLRGVRPMLQDIAEDDWILSPELAPGLAAMEALDLVFDALIEPRHLPSICALADRRSGLRIVIDHAAKPRIDLDQREPWLTWMTEAGGRDNVFCKMSGLSSQCGRAQAVEAAAPYLREIVSIFPADKILWGSDWPVVNTQCSYQQWLSICVRAARSMSEDELANIFCNTAMNVYKLGGVN